MGDHIVVITTSLSAGGAEKQAVAIANGLSQTDEVSLVTLTSADFRAAQIDERVEWICLDLPAAKSYLSNPRDLRRCISALKALQPTAVLSLNFPAQALVTLAQSCGLKTRHVISERQEHLGSRSRVLMRRVMYRRAWAVTANAEATAVALTAAGLATTGGVVTIPNIVDISAPTPRPTGQRRFKWICIARLDEQKDIKTLLHAAARLQKSGSDFELVVVGTGSDADTLQDLTKELHLADTVTFLGQRTDAMVLLEASDALVLSSLWEGTPNVVLEAAARGIPVAATDVGGTREGMPTQMHRFLVPPGQPGRLADSMRSMMSMSDADRDRLGAAMIAHIEKNFSEPEIIARWHDTLLGNR